MLYVSPIGQVTMLLNVCAYYCMYQAILSTNSLCCDIQRLLGIDEDLAKHYHKLVAEDRQPSTYITHIHADIHVHLHTLFMYCCILIVTWIVFILEDTLNILKEKFYGKNLIVQSVCPLSVYNTIWKCCPIHQISRNNQYI